MTSPREQEQAHGGPEEPEVGHVRRRRLLVLSALGIGMIVALLLVMLQGALTAKITIAGPAGKLAADRFLAQGTVEYPLVVSTEDTAVPVLTDGFRHAEAANFCFSLPVIDAPGLGPVVVRLATPGARGFQAEDLMATAEQINGNLVRRGAEFGRDAAGLDMGPPGATGLSDRFGLQSQMLEAYRLRIVTRSIVGLVRLDQVRIAVGGHGRDCF